MYLYTEVCFRDDFNSLSQAQIWTKSPLLDRLFKAIQLI